MEFGEFGELRLDWGEYNAIGIPFGFGLEENVYNRNQY